MDEAVFRPCFAVLTGSAMVLNGPGGDPDMHPPGTVGHCDRSVQDIGEVLEEVYSAQTAGAGERTEDASAPCAGVAAKEEGVVSGEGDISVRAFDKVVVAGYVAIVCDGLDVVPFIEEVVDGFRHQDLQGIFICHSLHSQPFRFISDCHRLSIRPCRSCACAPRHIGSWLTR